MSGGTDMKRQIWLLLLAASALVLAARPAMAGEDWVRVLSPLPGGEVIAKKPDIKAEFLVRVDTEKLMVTLDGTDVTQVASVTDKGFEYTPVVVLPPGRHTLSVTVRDSGGKTLTSTTTFTTRQTGPFEEAYSTNDVSVIYTNTLSKSESLKTVPYWKVEGNIASNSKVRNDGFQAMFTTNVRYLEQGIPLTPPTQTKPGTLPLSKGFNVANWLLKAGYDKDKFGVHAGVGDVVVDSTPYTVAGLARRGGMLDLSYDMFSAGAFSVLGRKVYGFRGGFGIDPETDRHISGAFADVKLPEGKAELKAVYAAGGETGGSDGITTGQGPKQGDVAGVMLVTDLLQGKLRTECEADTSRYDPDTSDEFGKKSDYAYRLRAGGAIDTYYYDVMYEYVGREYVSIGNLGLENDRAGVTASGGGVIGAHSVAVMFTQKEKNVDDDPMLEKTRCYLGSVNYSYLGIRSLPMGISYTKTVQDQGYRPLNSPPKENESDTVNGWINYSKDKLRLGLMSNYTELNDRTSAKADITTINCTFTSSYGINGFSVSPSFIMNQTKLHATGVWTGVYSINLDTRARFLEDRGGFDLGGAYVITRASDDSVDNLSLTMNFRLSYALKELERLTRGYVKPAVAVTGTYTNLDDRRAGATDRDEYAIYLQLTASIPLSI